MTPYQSLHKPLRTLDQYKRDRHAKRMRAVYSQMRDSGMEPEDFAHILHDEWFPRAQVDNNRPKSCLRRELFNCLRNNLIASKGDWSKAYDYMLDDADAIGEREREELELDQEADWQHVKSERSAYYANLL